jgi:hypothetical protein
MANCDSKLFSRVKFFRTLCQSVRTTLFLILISMFCLLQARSFFKDLFQMYVSDDKVLSTGNGLQLPQHLSEYHSDGCKAWSCKRIRCPTPPHHLSVITGNIAEELWTPLVLENLVDQLQVRHVCLVVLIVQHMPGQHSKGINVGCWTGGSSS